MTNMKDSPGLASGFHGSIMCIEVIICCHWNRASVLLMEQNINRNSRSLYMQRPFSLAMTSNIATSIITLIILSGWRYTPNNCIMRVALYDCFPPILSGITSIHWKILKVITYHLIFKPLNAFKSP